MSDEADWDEWIDTIDEIGVNLTKWEDDFVQSLKERRDKGWKLSERQAEILERIFVEKTP